MPSKCGPTDSRQPLAGLRWNDAARRAGQEPDSEPPFQSTDRMAERRGRNAELSRSAGEAAFLCDGPKGDQRVEVELRHYSEDLNSSCQSIILVSLAAPG